MKRVALAVPVLLLAAACGGGSDKDQTASGSSKAEFITKAEAICKQVLVDKAKLTFPTTAAAFPTYVQDVLDLAQRTADQVAALTPPDADKAEIESKVITPIRAQIELGKAYLVKVKAAAAANDQKKLGELVTSPPTGQKADLDWMRSYGFHDCVTAAQAGG